MSTPARARLDLARAALRQIEDRTKGCRERVQRAEWELQTAREQLYASEFLVNLAATESESAARAVAAEREDEEARDE